jgi:hypothetical protein
MIDYAKFFAANLEIIDKHGKIVPFLLNPPQLRFLDELERLMLLLKARQMGFSAEVLGMYTTDFLLEENLNIVVISHEGEATKKLFRRVKFYLESFLRKQTLYPGLTLKDLLETDNRNEIVNRLNGCHYYIGTAGAKAFGRGDTIHRLHGSEVAFWPNLQEVLAGLLNALTQDGIGVLESTANGYNEYQQMWSKAEMGESAFKNFFAPYHELPEYQEPGWKERKIKEFNDPRLFMQEFPATPEEAFLSSGNPFFDIEAVKRLLDRSMKPEISGGMTMEGIWL